MTIGESGLAVLFAVAAFLCLIGTAKAVDAPFAFHAFLGLAASLARSSRSSTAITIAPPCRCRRSTAGRITILARSNSPRSWRCSGDCRVHRRIVDRLPACLAGCSISICPGRASAGLRPLHTSAVIFAFGRQRPYRDLVSTSCKRTCRVRLAGDLAPWFVVLGYNFFILIAGTGYLLGVTQSKEYAEPEWYADLWLTIVWVTYLLVIPDHADQAQGAAYLRRQLVLPGLHRHHRGTPRRKQPRGAGFGVRLEVIRRLGRRPGRDVPVVVWPQCRLVFS